MNPIFLGLKLSVPDYFQFDEKREKEYRIIKAVDNGKPHSVKLTSNGLNVEYDKKDARNIVKLHNVKIVYKFQDGCLILKGNLGCRFSPPFGGEFFVKYASIDKTDFDKIVGAKADLVFCSTPMSVDETKSALERICENENFVFNVSQFDEFMDIFSYYKTLSAGVNNNKHFRIRTISKPYKFAPADVKGIETDDENAVRNADGIVIGYRIEQYRFLELRDEIRDQVYDIVDLDIDAAKEDIKQIRRFSDNLYLDENEELNDRFTKNLNSFRLIKTEEVDGRLRLSGEMRYSDKTCRYLHLYDMGQKVKLESIDNSLRLIKQGASGAAAELLEYIIGDKPMPSNRAARRAGDNKDEYAKGLDETQKSAFMMATDGSPVSLIKGPPGTGKTHVINAIVQYVTKELGQKVIISSQTHVAIDNVLDKIMENYDLIIPNRITNRRNKYSVEEIDSTIYKTWGKKFSSHNARATDTRLSALIAEDMKRFRGEKSFCFSEKVDESEYSVIGATTTTSAIGGKKGLELFDGYDWLIIDEVSKCPITEVLRYLPYVSYIIMVGDDFQLAPLLELQKDDVEKLPEYDEDKYEKLRKIYEESVFAKTLKKAESAGRLEVLKVNYRSVKDVLNAYNIFYSNQLQGRRELVNPDKVRFVQGSPFGQKDVFFVDVKAGKEAKYGTSRFNVEELRATTDVLKKLIKDVENPQSVSLSAIFPYAAQIEKFQKENRDLINLLKKTFKSFEYDTVDAFQGRETDIVLVNTVVTDSSQHNFLSDFRRINVSMSRAKDKLFVFGNPYTLSRINMSVSGGGKRRYFADIIEDIRRFGMIIKYDGGNMDYEAAGKAEIIVE